MRYKYDQHWNGNEIFCPWCDIIQSHTGQDYDLDKEIKNACERCDKLFTISVLYETQRTRLETEI